MVDLNVQLVPLGVGQEPVALDHVHQAVGVDPLQLLPLGKGGSRNGSGPPFPSLLPEDPGRPWPKTLPLKLHCEDVQHHPVPVDGRHNIV